MPIKNTNTERFGSRYRSAASHYTAALCAPVDVLGMRLRRMNRPKADLITMKCVALTMVEKCEAVKR